MSPVSPVWGLSPRVRGNQAGVEDGGGEARSIPACAGEPDGKLSTVTLGAVYPRVCGGTTPTDSDRALTCGLSPRVRGNRYAVVVVEPSLGSIPACAGEPLRHAASCTLTAVYPRVCGGTSIVTRMSLAVPGLSPRVRGNLPWAFNLGYRRGSIPACAGEPV